MINVCVPVLKRYDLLREMLFSLEKTATVQERRSEVRVYIIDNGQDGRRLKIVTDSVDLDIETMTPGEPMGVAESWNWFLQNVDEERVIVNDDVLFSARSIDVLAATPGDLVWAANPRDESIGFSCFVLRDSCIEKIGYFDETISPGYGYYEDEDYMQRIDGRGTKRAIADVALAKAKVLHVKSATLKSYSNAEMQEHHRKFKIAQDNYAKKWNVVFDKSAR